MSDTALVTGTAQGIGRGIAERLERNGLTVHRVDKDEVDLSDPVATAAYVAGLGVIDVLVNVAGGVAGQTHVPIEDVTDDAWDAVLDANLRTALNCIRAVVPGMKQRAYGRIVTISSGAGRSVSLTGIQAYATAKAGQIALTRQLAHELGPSGITVNCVAPGFVLSNPSSRAQWDAMGETGQRDLVSRIAMRRIGTPDDVARAVQFLVDRDAGWISGQTLSVDGGHSLF